MDVTVTPPNAVWNIIIDGVPEPVITQLWIDPNDLRLTYAGNTPISDGSVTLITEDPNLRSSLGAIADAPQSVIFFP